MQHYPDLNALLRSEPEAKHYFDTLPDYAREQMNVFLACYRDEVGIAIKISCFSDGQEFLDSYGTGYDIVATNAALSVSAITASGDLVLTKE